MIKRNVLLGRDVLLVSAFLATAGFSAAALAKTARPGGGSALLPRAVTDQHVAPETSGVKCQGPTCAKFGPSSFNEGVDPAGVPSVEAGGAFFGSAVKSGSGQTGSNIQSLTAKIKRLLIKIPVVAQAASFFSEGGKSAAEASAALTNAVQESVSWDAETKAVLQTFIQTAALGEGGLPSAIEEAKGISDPQEQKQWLDNMIEQCQVPAAAAL